jgi:hypothetical protein
MARNFIFAMLLSLLVSVQALAASCDIRCTSMESSTDCHSMQAAGPTAHCHSHTLQASDESRFTANHSCASSPCRTDLTATSKSAYPSDAKTSGRLLLSSAVLLTDPFQNIAPAGATSLAFARPGGSSPLAQRPGSSLRI